MLDRRDDDAPLADDLLHGVEQIAEFLGVNKRRAFYLLEGGHLPAGKLGDRVWIASRSALREHFERLTRGTREGGKK